MGLRKLQSAHDLILKSWLVYEQVAFSSLSTTVVYGPEFSSFEASRDVVAMEGYPRGLGFRVLGFKGLGFRARV